MPTSRWRPIAAALGVVAAAAAAVTALRFRRKRKTHPGWTLIGKTSELTAGPSGWENLLFKFEEADACALRLGEQWIAFTRSCPHAGIDLLSGDIEDLGQGPIISCTAHAYLFDANTGACLWDASRQGPPRTPSLTVFEVEESYGDVYVRRKPPPEPVADDKWDKEQSDALQMKMVEKVLDRKYPD